MAAAGSPIGEWLIGELEMEAQQKSFIFCRDIVINCIYSLRAYNKMTLYSSGLFFVLTASGCIDNALALPVSPSLQDKKTLAFGTTIHFVRDS
jgi:hypothetical protein